MVWDTLPFMDDCSQKVVAISTSVSGFLRLKQIKNKSDGYCETQE